MEVHHKKKKRLLVGLWLLTLAIITAPEQARAQFNLGGILEKMVEEVKGGTAKRSKKEEKEQDAEGSKADANEQYTSDNGIKGPHDTVEWITAARKVEAALLEQYPVYRKIFAAFRVYREWKTSEGKNLRSRTFDTICENEFDEVAATLAKTFSRAFDYERCGDAHQNWRKFLTWYIPGEKQYSGTSDWFYFTPVPQEGLRPQWELGYIRDSDYPEVRYEPLLYAYSGPTTQTSGYFLDKYARGTWYPGASSVHDVLITLAANFNMLVAVEVTNGAGSKRQFEWRKRFEEHLAIASKIGEVYLFSTTKNRKQVRHKVEHFELNSEILDMYISLLDDQKNYAGIVSAYEETLASYTPESPEEKEFRSLYSTYYEIESCYLARKDYAVVYMPKAQFSSAKESYNRKARSIKLSNAVKEKLKAEIDESAAWRRNMEISGGRYTEERKSECGIFAYSMLQ